MIDPSEGQTKLEVPRSRVQGEARGGVWLVLAAGIAVVGVALAGSMLPTGGDRPSPTTAVIAAAPTGTPSPSVPSLPPFTPPPDNPLPTLPNEILPFADVTAFILRDGDDAEVRGWRSGDSAFQSLHRLPGAFTGTTPETALTADLSPDGRYLIVRSFGDGIDQGRALARVIRVRDGKELWTRTDLRGMNGTAWSADSRALVLAQTGGPWIVVRIDSRERPQGARFEVPADDAVPVGFSADGHWVFAAAFGDEAIRPAFRINTRDGSSDPIESFPVGGGAGLVGAAEVGRAIDPATGRLLVEHPGAETSRLEVVEPDGSHAFDVPSAPRYGAAWTGDGGLVVFESEGDTRAGRTRLVPVDRHGQRGEPVFEIPILESAALLFSREGYAALGLASGMSERLMLVVVRLSDGATSSVEFDQVGLEGVLAIDWFAPPA